MIDFDKAKAEWRIRYKPKNADGDAGRWYIGPSGFADRAEAEAELAKARAHSYEAELQERWCTEWQGADR